MISHALPQPENRKKRSTSPRQNTVIHAQTIGCYHYPKHKTPYLLATNFIGRGRYKLNDRPIEITNQHFYFLNANDEFEITFDERDKVGTTLILFEDQLLSDSLGYMQSSNEEMLQDPHGYKYKTPTIPPVPYKFTKVMNKLMTQVVKPGVHKESLDETLIELVCEFQKLNQKTGDRLKRLDAVKNTTKQELYTRVFLARDYMHDNVSSVLSLDQIARAVGMNKFHLLTNFQKVFNTTPHQYLIQLKMKRAKQMLDSQRYSVSQTCFALGFESMGSFSNSFKKTYQMRPSELRK